MNASRHADTGTSTTRILDTAERLVQARGFNGFSYADVADELDVTKASVHSHFAGKADLGESLISRYAARFAEALVLIEARPVPDRLAARDLD
jgi:TetR/AcrR family transcriptional repressor of nem operon